MAKETFIEEQERAYRYIDAPCNRDPSQYNIGKYSYPEDVGNSPDLKHTIAFYINIRGNSKYKTNDNTQFKIADEQMLTKQGVIAGVAVAVGGTIATSLYKNLSAVAAELTRKIVGNSPAAKGPSATSTIIKDARNAALVGAAVAGVTATFENTELWRLKDAIVLAVQEPPKTTYRVNYDKFDAGVLMGVASKTTIDSLTGDILGGAKAGILKFAQVPAAVGAPDFMRGALKATGTAINPYRTTLFQDVDLRTFAFNYKFMPKTKDEATNVLNIINTFKFHMHPEFASDKMFLIHPAEFNIVYYYNGKENQTWNKIATCVLTEMELDAGTEQLASFADGQSVEINMRLVFMETEMITKERIKDGY